MMRWFRELDRLLRGELTQLSVLKTQGFQLPLRGITCLIVFLGALTGVCMATYALLHQDGPRFEQLLASTVKVPALFLLTLIVTFPSLYVFNALMGSRLRWTSNLRLLVGSLGVTLAVVASFGPIVAFFSLSTTSYPFIVLLNVVTFGIAGALGLTFLLLTLHRLSLIDAETPPVAVPVAALDGEPLSASEAFIDTPPTAKVMQRATQSYRQSALEALPQHVLGRHIWTVFRIWIFVFALVGSQMSWILRPFIGNPNEPFAWFRPRQSNFFEAVWGALTNLF